jgi:hypothetical protein
MIKNISILVITLSIAALTGLAFMQTRTLRRDEGITSCLKTAQIQLKKPSENVTMITPESYWYNFCMKEKGLK